MLQLPRPNLVVSGLLIAACLPLLIAWGCSRAPDDARTAEPPASDSITEAALRACPRGDTIWYQAINQAHQAGELAGFVELARSVSEEFSDRWEPAWAAGESLLRQRSLEAAGEQFEEALRRAESAGDSAGVSRIANALGWLAFSIRRDPEGAEELYRRALSTARDVGREDLEARANNNLAGLLLGSGRLAEGLDRLQAAIVGLNRVGMEAAARQAGFNRANYLYQLGSLVEALEALDQLYEEAVGANDANLVAFVALLRGHLHRGLNEIEEAKTWYARVTDVNPRVTAAVDLGLGRLALENGAHDEAVRRLDAAASQEHNAEVALLAGTHRAEIELLRGDADAARERLVPLLDEADRAGVDEVAYIGRMFLGKALVLDSELPAAAEQFRRSVEIIESQGAGLDPTKEGMAYLRERAEPYADLAAALAELGGSGRLTEIFQTIERSHARALRRVLREGGDAGPRIFELDELSAGLASDELLLDFIVGEDRGVVLAVGAQGARAHTLPGWRQLREPLQRYRRALLRPLISAEARLDPEDDLRRDVEAAKALRRQLLGPVDDLLAGVRRIYVVPDQDLALLPFAALPLEESGSATVEGRLSFLGEAFEIAVLPMAGAPPAWSGPRTPILLAGDPLPDPEGDFGALPLASAELSRLGEIWSADGATRLEAADLSPDRLRQLPLEEFRTLHFATHAVASSLDPRRCAVIFSGGEKLAMREVAELELGPSLVVLSACRTGEGEVIPGEGVVGLSWAFLRAGARGIAASLWSVEDASTAELMAALHRNLRSGHDPVRALALAQRELQSERGHPAYWAPFVVILSPGP